MPDSNTREFAELGPAQFRSATADQETRSIDVVLSTDAPTRVFDPGSMRMINEVLRSDGADIPDSLPLTDEHFLRAKEKGASKIILGSVRDIRVEGSELIGRAYFAEGVDQADRAWKLAQQGHLRDASVGYQVTEKADVHAGRSRSVKGRDYEGGTTGLRVSTKWRPFELAATPVGANTEAKFREAMFPESGDKIMDEVLRKFLETAGMARGLETPNANAWFNGLDPELQKIAGKVRDGELNAEDGLKQWRSHGEPETDGSEIDTEPEPPNHRSALKQIEYVKGLGRDVTDPDEAARSAIEGERTRVRELREMAGEDVSPELLQRAIDKGWDTNRAAPAFLDDIRNRRVETVNGGDGNIQIGQTGAEALVRALSPAVALRGGVPIPQDDQKLAREAQNYTGIGLHAVARLCVESETGQRAPIENGQLFERAISTGSFPEILGDSARKSLMRAYSEYPGTATRWCGTRDTKDFLQHRDLQLSEFGDLEEVGDAGEITHGTLLESRENYQVATYGKQYSVTRKMFINDDLNAFMRIPMMLGNAARRNIDEVVYALLVSNSGVGPTMNEDSLALFHTAHLSGNDANHEFANYQTGSTTDLVFTDPAGLKSAKLLMRKQLGLRGETLNLTQRYLLAPPELEDDANRLGNSGFNIAAGDGDVIATDKNIHQGTFEIIIEPRLSAATNGTTAWYLIADPAIQDNVVIVYLNGRREPTVERHDPQNVLGIGWRMYHDVAAAAVNMRGIVRSAGA